MEPRNFLMLVVLCAGLPLAGGEGTQERAKAIRIPQFAVKAEPLIKVLDTITGEIRGQDPAGKGLDIQLGGDVSAAMRQTPLSMQARSISAEELIRHFCLMAGLHCEFGAKTVNVGLPPADVAPAAPGADHADEVASARERASQILLPELRLPELTPAAAFRHLRSLSSQYDPDGKGINFVLQISAAGKARLERSSVDLDLKNIRLDQAIRYACVSAGLHYRFDRSAVIISDTPFPREKLDTRIYDVEPGAAMPRHTRRRPKKIDWQD